MLISERIELFEKLFNDLQETNSRVTKMSDIQRFLNFYPELEEDFNYIIEVLAGKHKIGWTYQSRTLIGDNCGGNGCEGCKDCGASDFPEDFESIKEIIENLKALPNRTEQLIEDAELLMGEKIGKFIEPIVNRTLKLGIAASLLSVDPTTPMLAKTYLKTGKFTDPDDWYYITEKYNGTRSCTVFNELAGGREYYSRSGKCQVLDFDMSQIPDDLITDGEVLDPTKSFNESQGNVNAKDADKSGQIYLIFDFMNTDLPYEDRRVIGERLQATSNVKFIPVLEKVRLHELESRARYWLAQMRSQIDPQTGKPKEGIMINSGKGMYQGGKTRRDCIQKFKEEYTTDMKVVGWYPGDPGTKYEFAVGGLELEAEFDGKLFRCKCGGGLSDDQRFGWYEDPSLIYRPDKPVIVEIAYTEISQNKNTLGTTEYSYQFPRLKKVRYDKTDVSQY